MRTNGQKGRTLAIRMGLAFSNPPAPFAFQRIKELFVRSPASHEHLFAVAKTPAISNSEEPKFHQKPPPSILIDLNAAPRAGEGQIQFHGRFSIQRQRGIWFFHPSRQSVVPAALLWQISRSTPVSVRHSDADRSWDSSIVAISSRGGFEGGLRKCHHLRMRDFFQLRETFSAEKQKLFPSARARADHR
jgi:hypothetical protein